MPEQKNRGNSDFSKYDTMSDEELEEILRSDIENTEGTESDPDLILYIMGVLADRDNTEPAKSAEEAFASFKEHYYPLEESPSADEDQPIQNTRPSEKQKKNRWIHRSLAAAAMVALILLTSVSVKAFKFDLWGELVKWTEEVFHFGSNFQSNQEEPFEDDTEFDSLIEALEKKNIPADIIPTWLPEDYKFENIQIVESPRSTLIIALFVNADDEEIKLQIKDYITEHVQQIEKSDKYFDIYKSKDKKYYIFDNNQIYEAVCTEQNIELYIAGDMSLEQLYNMLKSIEGE